MIVNNVSSTDFQGLRKAGIIISDNMKKDIQQLMYKMNHDTTYEQSANGNSFKSYILGAVKINNKAFFMDNRFLCVPTDKTRNLGHPDCSIEFGGSKLKINSQTGEAIVDKPFWKNAKRVIKKGHKYIKKALDNYNNPKIVDKKSIGIAGFTEKGEKIIETAKKKAGLG